MRETEKRIKAYRAMLPRMRERVIAAISLLAIALATMTSATYAWLVLSQAPEVKGLQTTLAANGNLEIALAGRMGEQGQLLSPANSAVGDGILGIVDKNLTWGNLVNLGDPAYALDNIVLRPAQLNDEPGALLTSPLYAATYGADGRVEQLFSNFGYTYAYSDANGNAFLTEDEIIKKLTAANPDTPAIFKKYGVRAVSSTKVSYNSDYSRVLADKLNKAESSIVQAQNAMAALAKHEALQTLLDLAGRYLGAEVADMTGGDSKNTAVTDAEIDALVSLFDALLDVCDKSADALADLYKFEVYLRTEDDRDFVLDLSKPWSEITSKLNEQEEINGNLETLIQISDDARAQLKKLRDNYQTLQNSRNNIAASKGKKVMYAKVVADPDAVFISGWLEPIFNINTVTIEGETIPQITAKVSEALGDRSFGALMSGAGTVLNILNTIKNAPEVIITEGILVDVHKFTGQGINGVYSFSCPTDGSSVSSIIGKSIDVTNANIQTVAEEPYALKSEKDRVKSSTTGYKGSTAQAADTYGLVLDFWVRTNSANSKLTLEGAPVYNTYELPITAMIDGAEKELYTVSVYVTEEGELASSVTETTVEFEAYIDGSQYIAYDRETQTKSEAVCATNSPAVKEAVPLVETISELVGYNGVNRVWDDMNSDANNSYDYSNSTTMGSGSCYVFYPKSADDQAKSIQLLQNLRIAFISQNGTLLGEGVMDTEHVIEQAGKVIVPLVCHYKNASTTIINDEGKEETIYYITDLAANTPTLVTALVYLDGQELSNDQVLSANDIQGHLNIQFGTTAGLSAMDDPVLREERCTVTATMTDGEGLSTLTSQKLTDTQAQRTKHIEVKVEGVTPSRVTAYFQRVLNNTQGIRQQEIVFNDQGNGIWTADYEFVNAGDYILREVLVDGVTYDLDQENPISYSLSGYAINSLNFEGGRTPSESYGFLTNGATYVTTERRFTADVVLNFTREGEAPTSIKGAFVHQATGNRVTVAFRRDGSVWRGSAVFATTGVYRLERLEIDGDPVGVPSDKMLSLNLYLGVTANVSSNKTQIGLNDDNPTGKVNMSMTVVADNNARFSNLSDVVLVYSKNGSATDDNTLRAAMVWNKDTQSYQGEFEITSSGTYTFLRAEMTINGNDNVIRSARTSPALTVTKADEIPEFSMQENLGGSVFSMNNDASFSITLKEAASVTADAKIVDANGKVYYVRGGHMEEQPDGTMKFVATPSVSRAVTRASDGEELYTFTFYLPLVGEPLSQTGTWTLEAIYLTNTYDANGTFYGASTDNGPLAVGADGLGDRDPYSVSDWYYDRWWKWTQEDLFEGDKAAFTITVSDSIELGIHSGQSTIHLGGTADNVTGVFGATYTPDGILVDLTAGGQALGEGLSVDNITLIYGIDENASFEKIDSSTTKSKLGGYTFATGNKLSLLGLNANGKLVFGGSIGSGYVEDNGDGTYLLLPQKNLSAAGVYVAETLTATITSGDQSRNENGKTAQAPRIELRHKKPTVTITGVSGSPTKPQKITYNEPGCGEAPTFVVTEMSGANSGVNSDTNTAILYATAKAENDTQHNGTFTAPTLTVTVAGVSNDSVVSFILPGGSADSITFSRTGNGTIAKSIGKVNTSYKTWKTTTLAVIPLTHTLYAYYGHGEQTIDQITVTQNGVTFTFTLDVPMTVINPSSTNQS